jgi:2-polyprenyl-3-methyl-5-hydroxy-6-metoxy-1,4-benzoquinol methylase
VNDIICPVCGSSDSGTLFSCTDFFVSRESFPILVCHRCGFRKTGSAPTEEVAGRYYQSEEYVSHSDTRQGFTNRMYHHVRALMLNRKKNLLVEHTGLREGSLLDIGAGTGYFLKFMQGKGWNVKGTEKSASARAFASRQWNLELFSEEGLDSLPPHSFDAVTLWHVMEHLYDPDMYWDQLTKLLKPEGCLFIALPNPDSADALHYGAYWAAWDVPRHLWHFSPENIIGLGGKYGFQLQKTVRMPSMLSTFPFSVKNTGNPVSR